MQCLACQNDSENLTFAAREMMIGLRDSFNYQECSNCGSIQITAAPVDLGKYYGEGYYSFCEAKPTKLKRYLKRKRSHHALGRPQPLGALMCLLTGVPEFAKWVQVAGLTWDDAILDVGCGIGHLLQEMKLAGFEDLTGCDPFLPSDMNVEGVRLRKAFLMEIDRSYDFVMLHHSFEHMNNPSGALREIHRLLKPGKSALIRCPVAGSYAWRTYGSNWVQLDAPRHLFIPSLKGFAHLAEATGFELWKTTCDSTEFQFSGSELYRRDVPLRTGQAQKLISPSETRRYARLATELNQKLDGDSACFYLRKPQAPVELDQIR